MKKSPGPLAPPETRRPRRKITALSYSWTTLKINFIQDIQKFTYLNTKPNRDGKSKKHQQVGKEANESPHATIVLSKMLMMIFQCVILSKIFLTSSSLSNAVPKVGL
jgi:hypothetical protein